MPPHSFGRVPKFAVIDVKNDPNDLNKSVILGIKEDGTEGTIHEVTMHESDQANGKRNNLNPLSVKRI